VQRRKETGGAAPAAERPTRYAAAVNPLTTEQIILLLAPVVLIQLGLMIAALVDLERDERHVRGNSKVAWALIIVFVNIIGPIVYFVVGREEG
jgi:Phospholipase_D-nuclease N-terminal